MVRILIFNIGRFKKKLKRFFKVVRGTRCGLRVARFGVRVAGFALRGASYGVIGVGHGLRFWIADSGFRIGDLYIEGGRYSIWDFARPPRLSPPQADDPPATQGTSGHGGGQGLRICLVFTA